MGLKLRYYVSESVPAMSTLSSHPEVPIKLCPACETRLPVAAVACGICGHVFGAAQTVSDTVADAAHARPLPTESDVERDDAAADAAAAPQPARFHAVMPSFTTVAGAAAIPGRSVWLIGLVSAVSVLLLSVAISMLKPRLAAQATTPPTLTDTPPAPASPTALQPSAASFTVAPPTALPPTASQPTATPSATPPPTEQTGRVIGAVPSVALRSGPGTQFAALRQLPPGQGVAMQCQVSGSVPAAFASGASDKWVRVGVEGVTGFVYSALLETSAALPQCDSTQ